MTPEKQAIIDRNHAEIDRLRSEIKQLDETLKVHEMAYAGAALARDRRLRELNNLRNENIRLLRDYVMPKGDPDED
jgi:hypothetical protein